MSPDFPEGRKEALSGIEIPSVLGGASPLPEPSALSSDDWLYHYFIVIPFTRIKPYNHEGVQRMISRVFLEKMGNLPPDFPPTFEGWGTSISMCVRVHCTRELFEELRAELKGIYVTFGGALNMLKYYQASSAEQM